MAQVKISYNKATKVATVGAAGSATPDGAVVLGTVNHDPSHITDKESPKKHVMFQTVQNMVLLSGETNFDGFSIVDTTV